MLQPYGMRNDNSEETYFYDYSIQVLPSKHILTHELLWTDNDIDLNEEAAS